MHLLVIRTSAMGDVALMAPVIRSMRVQYPDVEVTLVTRSAFSPFFSSISGVNLYFPDFAGRHKGFAGVLRLYKDITSEQKIDYVIDLHNVLRTWLLRSLFLLRGIHHKSVDKGRYEKRLLIRGKRKLQLKHTIIRYCDVFAAAGFPVTPGTGPWIIPSAVSIQNVAAVTGITGSLKVGVAPCSRHDLKTWPEENIIKLMNLISDKYKVRILLFGGDGEKDKLKELSGKIPGSFVAADQFNLDEQIAIISTLDFMISMDSANMHMAALTGIRVISIWGGTDPMAGFGAWEQPDEFSVRIPAYGLTCRPCTVYGKGECLRGDFACMHWLTPEMVFEKLSDLKIL